MATHRLVTGVYTIPASITVAYTAHKLQPEAVTLGLFIGIAEHALNLAGKCDAPKTVGCFTPTTMVRDRSAAKGLDALSEKTRFQIMMADRLRG